MKYLKTYESFFVSQEEVDELLDKISSSKITSLSDIEKNRLTLFSENDKKIIDLIEQMAEITLQFKNLYIKMDELSIEQSEKLFKKEWKPLNNKMIELEHILRNYGIELGDERLTRLMKKQRPDAYNTNVLD